MMLSKNQYFLKLIAVSLCLHLGMPSLLEATPHPSSQIPNKTFLKNLASNLDTLKTVLDSEKGLIFIKYKKAYQQAHYWDDISYVSEGKRLCGSELEQQAKMIQQEIASFVFHPHNRIFCKNKGTLSYCDISWSREFEEKEYVTTNPSARLTLLFENNGKQNIKLNAIWANFLPLEANDSEFLGQERAIMQEALRLEQSSCSLSPPRTLPKQAVTVELMQKLAKKEIPLSQFIDPEKGLIDISYQEDSPVDDFKPTYTKKRFCGKELLTRLPKLHDFLSQFILKGDFFKCQNKPTPICSSEINADYGTHVDILFNHDEKGLPRIHAIIDHDAGNLNKWVQVKQVHNITLDLLSLEKMSCSPTVSITQMELANARKSMLPFELAGTVIVPGDKSLSFAILKDQNKQFHPFGKGEHILETDAVVINIIQDRVYIQRSDQAIEYIDKSNSYSSTMVSQNSELDQEIDKHIKCSGNTCTTEREFANKLLANTTALSSMGRFSPYLENGKQVGFRVSTPRGVLAKIGMKSGDILQNVNGLELSSPDRALEAHAKLKTSSHITLSIKRGSEILSLDINITP